jgi:hypothetical protein
MINDPQHRPDAPGGELLEGADRTGPSVVPVSVAPASRLRSPIMEHRPIEPLPADHDRPTMLLPPLRAFIGPSGLTLLIAAPMLLVAGLQVALISALGAVVLHELHRRASRVTFSFGEGFLPYRTQTGWPQGVQEDDDVRWNWSSGSGRGASG